MIVKHFKKITAILFAIGSCAVHAGDVGMALENADVTIPYSKAGLDVAAYALYLKPAYTGELGTIGAVNFNVANATETFIDTDPNWNWGFKIEGAFHLRAGNDLNLNWYHLIGKSTLTNINDIDAPTNYGFRQRGTETHSIKPYWNAINIELGQKIDLTAFKLFRVHGGLQIVYIKAETSLDGYDSFIGFSSANDSHSAKAATTYSGFGPRVGIDMLYPATMGLDVYANLATALFAGTSKFYKSYSDNIVNSPPFPSTSSATRNSVVVPEIEGKLGLSYSKLIGQGTLTLDAGYMWLTYIGPLLFSQWKPTGNNFSLNVENMVDSESNFTLNGPYFGLKWLWNA